MIFPWDILWHKNWVTTRFHPHRYLWKILRPLVVPVLHERLSSSVPTKCKECFMLQIPYILVNSIDLCHFSVNLQIWFFTFCRLWVMVSRTSGLPWFESVGSPDFWNFWFTTRSFGTFVGIKCWCLVCRSDNETVSIMPVNACSMPHGALKDDDVSCRIYRIMCR